MARKPNPIPEGHTAITPYLRIKGAREAIDFYKKAFGAKVEMVMEMGPRIGHAELSIGGARMCLADEFPEMGALGPKSIGKTSVTIMHYCGDVDATMARAAAAGAKVTRPAADQFWGSRMGVLEDPFGHAWMIQTHVEDVSETEMKRRLSAMMAGPAKAPAARKPVTKRSPTKGAKP